MGLAASQARALLLVARKSDLEYRAQCLSQRKMVLAQQTEQLARDYSTKISNRKLLFVYNINGSSGETQTEDLNYYSLMDNNKVSGNYRVMDGYGNIIVASPSEIPQKRVKVKQYIKVTTDETTGKMTPVEVKKEDYQKSSNDEINNNHGDSTNKQYAALYVYSYDSETGKKVPVMIQDEDGKPNTSAVINTTDGVSYPVFTKKSTASSDEETYDNYELSAYGSNAAKYSKVVTSEYITTTEDMTGNSEYAVYNETYTYVDRELQADGYYHDGDDEKGARYLVIPTIANRNYFQNGLRNGSLILQQATPVPEYNAAGDKIGEQTAWDTVTWQGLDCIQDNFDTSDDALAQSEYEAKTAALKAQDQMLDMEIKQIETQHKAVETEWDSVKKIIDGNIDKTFKIFA